MRIAKTLKADKVLITRAHYAKQKELTEKVKEEQQKEATKQKKTA